MDIMDKIDKEWFERRADQSNFYKEEIVAINSHFPEFAEALRAELEIMQFDKKFLSKKYLKGFKESILYRGMEGTGLFGAFLDIEWDIKQMFRDTEKEIALEEKDQLRMNFKKDRK